MSLAERLAGDLPISLGPHRVTPFGVEWEAAVVATALPDAETARRWRGRRVVAASRALSGSLAELGIATADCRPPLPRPDRSLRRDADSGVVRSDGEPAAAVGAVLLCWALDVPGARVALGGDRAGAGSALAAVLGLPAVPAGGRDAPAAVLCCERAVCASPLLVDALAAGIPVVGWDRPELREVAGDAGLFVPDGSGVEHLAAALAAVLTEPNLAHELDTAGRSRVAELDPGECLRQATACLVA